MPLPSRWPLASADLREQELNSAHAAISAAKLAARNTFSRMSFIWTFLSCCETKSARCAARPLRIGREMHRRIVSKIDRVAFEISNLKPEGLSPGAPAAEKPADTPSAPAGTAAVEPRQTCHRAIHRPASGGCVSLPARILLFADLHQSRCVRPNEALPIPADEPIQDRDRRVET